MPRFLVLRAFNRLMLEVSETINKSAFEQELQKGVLRAKLYNKAFNLYPALVDIVQLTWDEEHLRQVEEITGMKLTKLDDRQMLVTEMRRLQDKYQELAKEEEKGEGVSLAQVVVSTEIVLEFNIDRGITLHEFHYYMQAANEKLKQYERLNEKV